MSAEIAEDIALVTDLSSAGIGIVDNAVQLIKANGPISFTSSAAIFVATVAAPIPIRGQVLQFKILNSNLRQIGGSASVHNLRISSYRCMK